MSRVLVENNGFWPETAGNSFLPWSTWFDPYWPSELGFGLKWRFWPETHFFYPGRHDLTRITPVNLVLVWNDGFDLKLIFYPSRHDLTRIIPVNSVLVGNDGFDPKQPENHFWWKDVVDSVAPQKKISARHRLAIFRCCVWLNLVRWSRHLVIDFGILGNRMYWSCQRFTGKGLVVVKEGISTLNAPYLR